MTIRLKIIKIVLKGYQKMLVWRIRIIFLPILALLLLLTLPSQTFSLFKKNQTSNLLEYELNTINVFEKNARSVVNVSNIKIAYRQNLFNFDITEIPSGAGSGFVWDNKGHIVTNYHVVHGGNSFLVSFHKDKKQYKAKIVGSEPKKDIAVLKLEQFPKNLQPIRVGNSSHLKVGQKAMAIGNPFSLDQTLTAGIISALGRKIQGIGGVKIHGMIQTDSSINPGNSGGPLLNSQGDAIGMNTAIYSPSGSSAGIGFAVPINTIKHIVPELIKYGKVMRPALGIELSEYSFKEHFGISKGVVIAYVNPQSPAAKAGLRGMRRGTHGQLYLGDVILAINNQKVNSYDDIYHALEKYKVGDQVSISYIRNGKRKKVQLELSSFYKYFPSK